MQLTSARVTGYFQRLCAQQHHEHDAAPVRGDGRSSGHYQTILPRRRQRSEEVFPRQERRTSVSSLRAVALHTNYRLTYQDFRSVTAQSGSVKDACNNHFVIYYLLFIIITYICCNSSELLSIVVRYFLSCAGRLLYNVD